MRLMSASQNSGSSPHTRGLQVCERLVPDARRIIPAHAGFTQGVTFFRAPGKDHPRTRGVYRTAKVVTPWSGGSSPHTRGLLETVMGMDDETRIIPAHAGFTSV